MGNVTDGTILTFSIRSQNSTEIERRQRAATRDRPAQNREPTDNRHYAQQTTSRHSGNLITIPSLLADQPYNTEATDKKRERYHIVLFPRRGERSKTRPQCCDAKSTKVAFHRYGESGCNGLN